MILDVIVGVDDGLLPNESIDWSVILAIIFIIVLIVVTVIMAILFFRRKKIYPMAVIKNEEDELLFAIYQLGKIYKVVNIQQSKFEPATFYDWSDVVSYIKNETKEWDPKFDFLNK